VNSGRHGYDTFIATRDLLLKHREDYEKAKSDFRWPDLPDFNWALDYFDRFAQGNSQAALILVDDGGGLEQVSFEDMRHRSNRTASWLRQIGVKRGDRVLLMLGNIAPLWELILACMKVGAVVIPTATLLQREELLDRLERGAVRLVVAESAYAERFPPMDANILRSVIGTPVSGWLSYEDARSSSADFRADGATKATDPLLLYFTSGTTARPKLVMHTHASYPVGHLSTMYWLGLKPGDRHLNLSSAGWAKHAWSCFFAPWTAGATVVAYQYSRFVARSLLDRLVEQRITTFCAPPTVWRMLVQEPLQEWEVALREAVSAGEPLNPEVIEAVRRSWGIVIRDGYGQTETTAQVGNPPGALVKPGSMGRALPGYSIELLDTEGKPAEEGEICIDLSKMPLGVMQGYSDDAVRTGEVLRGGYYHTGDVAQRDAEGYLTYVGRTDDVFKSSDYRISPFELESVLVEHPAVAESAVVPTPDAMRLSVPKAYVLLAAGHEPTAEVARSIFEHCHRRMAPYKRIRCLQFAELPKTISGKIRRSQLRKIEEARNPHGGRMPQEFWAKDLSGPGDPRQA
jgi:acetyl-CoA synthetase